MIEVAGVRIKIPSYRKFIANYRKVKYLTDERLKDSRCRSLIDDSLVKSH